MIYRHANAWPRRLWRDNPRTVKWDESMSRTPPPPDLDFEKVFDLSPSLVLVLDPGFKIVAQNQAHARATLSDERGLVGTNLFAAFPDNPERFRRRRPGAVARLAAQGAEDPGGRHHRALPL